VPVDAGGHSALPFQINSRSTTLTESAYQERAKMKKLQVRFIHVEGYQPPPEGFTHWQDCVNLPPLETQEQAEQFLIDINAHTLEELCGLEFRTVDAPDPKPDQTNMLQELREARTPEDYAAALARYGDTGRQDKPNGWMDPEDFFKPPAES
jgi:hypothetical protein